MSDRCWQKGFTLTELLVAIAVLAIVLSLSAPSFQSLLTDSRMAAGSSQLRAALVTSRSQAITSNRRVTLCTSVDKSSCTDGSWADGSIAFIDGGIRGEVNDGDEILKVFRRISPQLSLFQNNIAGSVSFTPDGASDSSGSFILCDQNRHAKPRRVCLSLSGTISSGKADCIEHSIACPT